MAPKKRKRVSQDDEEEEEINYADYAGSQIHPEVKEVRLKKDSKWKRTPYVNVYTKKRGAKKVQFSPKPLALDVRPKPEQIDHFLEQFTDKTTCFIEPLPHVPLTKLFWMKLLGRHDVSWLEGDHINAWLNLLNGWRGDEERWTILDTALWAHPITRESCFSCTEDYMLKWGDGRKERQRAWWDVDEVYFPINLAKDEHWVLGVLNLQRWTFTVYDSSTKLGLKDKLQIEITQFESCLPDYLNAIDYFKKAGKPPVSQLPVLERIFQDNIPQQSGMRGDCGVFVCMWMHRLTRGQSLELDKPSFQAATSYRMYLFATFYSAMIKNPNNKS